jgi:hypothetical protein
MSARSSAVVALAGLLLGAPAIAAERATPQRATEAAQPSEARPAAVLAAASPIELREALDPQAAAAPAPKRRAARVTSCRCGDQAAAAPAPAETPQR